jgi:hypothetical protein
MAEAVEHAWGSGVWLLRAIKSSAGPFVRETELFAEWPK